MPKTSSPHSYIVNAGRCIDRISIWLCRMMEVDAAPTA